jgi:hypothetical protein
MQEEVAYCNGKWYRGEGAIKEAEAAAMAAVKGFRRSAEFVPQQYAERTPRTCTVCAAQILANVLLDCHAVRLDIFHKIASRLKCCLDAHVDATNQSISCALEDYPTWFQRVGDSYIGRATGADDKFTELEVDLFFNDQMTTDVKLTVKHFFRLNTFAKETK